MKAKEIPIVRNAVNRLNPHESDIIQKNLRKKNSKEITYSLPQKHIFRIKEPDVSSYFSKENVSIHQFKKNEDIEIQKECLDLIEENKGLLSEKFLKYMRNKIVEHDWDDIIELSLILQKLSINNKERDRENFLILVDSAIEASNQNDFYFANILFEKSFIIGKRIDMIDMNLSDKIENTAMLASKTKGFLGNYDFNSIYKLFNKVVIIRKTLGELDNTLAKEIDIVIKNENLTNKELKTNLMKLLEDIKEAK